MYQALYRKYRPKDFDSVVGQEPIIKTLKNSIINHNFSHAYMFFGPRGTGKTTVSKIFARNVNCLNPIDGIACGNCDACLSSFSKDCVDIIEIDAASNNGVDEIRELKNNITLVPSELKYKVYIIDEFHMLSAGAFNALLKTLEEPPEHAIFILATTDPQKVPDTIVSRCQSFSFKRISEVDIYNRLIYVCNEEQICVDDIVLKRIALFSDGGLRDALSLLDKLVSYAGKNVTIEDFNNINGTLSDDDLNNFLSYVLCGDIAGTLNSINYFSTIGKNLLQILTQIINYSRDLIVNYYLDGIECAFSIDLLQLFVNTLNKYMFDIKNSGNTKVYIEMFLLKFINDNTLNNNSPSFTENNIDKTNELKVVDKNKSKDDDNNLSSESVIIENDSNNTGDVEQISANDDDNFDFNSYLSDDENESLNDSNISLSTNISHNFTPKIINMDEVNNVRINNTFSSANKDLLKKEINSFEKLKDYSFDNDIGYLVNSLLDSNIRVVGEKDFIISYDSDATVSQNLLNIVKLQEIYSKITGSYKNIAIISDEKWDILKKEYISNLKNNIKYDYVEEPQLLFEEINNDDIICSSAVSLFGEDIVEFE